MNYGNLIYDFFKLRKNTRKTVRQIKILQREKLDNLLLYAYDHSPYYKRAFEDAGIHRGDIKNTPLNRFPVIDKELLLNNFESIVTDPSLKQEDLVRFDEENSDRERIFMGKYHIVHSSGSTGTPRYFVYDENAWQQMLLGIVRGALWDMSTPQILKLLGGKPRVLYIAATEGRYGGALAVGDGIKGMGARQRFLDIDTPLTKWVETVREFRPNIIIGYPSAIKILSELIDTEGEYLKIKRIITCVEPLSPGLRQYIEDVFKVPVINFYGASESLALGVRRKADEEMYLFDDLNIIEVIDGAMYLTSLYNYAQPLIRYYISDQLALKQPGLNDKYPFTKADVLLCRDEDIMWFETKDGRKEYLHPLSIEGFTIEGLLDFQFRQLSSDSFEMIAEISSQSESERITKEMNRWMGEILMKNGLYDINFSIRFTDRIMPDPKTGKKPLIIK